MRVDPKQHLSRPLLIHRLAADFPLLDVWRLPAESIGDDGLTFERFLACFPLLRSDAVGKGTGITRLLFAVRALLLRVLGLPDDPHTDLPIPGCTEQSVRERMTEPERARFELKTDAGRKPAFVPVYATPDERLYEIANSTVHALMHLSWVAEGGSHSPYLAVYAKPRGVRGHVYMALITPFRHWIVYPSLMKSTARAWERARLRSAAA